MLPELPNYLTEMAGEDYFGIIIALFTAIARNSCPFSGELTEKIGIVPSNFIENLSCVFCIL
jgi:hypothetical protein